MGWIKSVRLKTVLIGVFLYVVACKLNNWEGFSWIIAIFILLLGMAIMAGNDWDDRDVDLLKGKTFAKEQGKKYLCFIYILWGFTFLPVLYLILINHPFALYSAILWMVCTWYSTVRSMKYIPGIYVSLIAAGAVGYPLINNPGNNYLWIFFVCVLFIVYGRENIKDLVDIEYDIGRKWTIPSIYGTQISKIVIIMCTLIGILCALFINPWSFLAVMVLIGPFFIYLIRDKYKNMKFILDMMILGTFGILLFTR